MITSGIVIFVTSALNEISFNSPPLATLCGFSKCAQELMYAIGTRGGEIISRTVNSLTLESDEDLH